MTKFEIEQRRQMVGELYLRKLTQAQIGAQLGYNQSTISRDIKVLETRWQNAAVESVDRRKAKELAELESMERDAIVRFNKSATELERVRWFSERLKCKDRIHRLLGLDAPGRVDISGAITHYHEHILTARDKLAQRLVDRAARSEAARDIEHPH